MLRLAHFEDRRPEIFHALQGEGPRAGRPSVFVRLSACNLWCSWCDTAYTWRWSTTHPHDDAETFDPKVEVVPQSAQQVVDAVLSHPCRALVVTGGEPLLQQKGLVDVLTALRAAGCTVDLETNGTVAPEPTFDDLVDLYVVSPKLSNAGVPENRRLTDALPVFIADPRAAFKFVVDTPADLDEVKAILSRYSLAPDRVWLMPRGRTAAALVDRRGWLAAACLELGAHFSDRLHVHLSGDTRGT